MKLRKHQTPALGVYLAAAAFYLWLAAQVPYTGDDWDWGLDIGLQHLLTADINSRYAGNLLVVIMTRSPLAKTLILGGCYFAIPFLMAKLASDSKNRLAVFLGCNCLILTMERAIWQQTYGWVSGFANYGVSAVLVLVCLGQVWDLFRQDFGPGKAGWGTRLLLFLLGAVMQLFLENLAIAMVLLSLYFLGLGWLRLRKVWDKAAALLLGNLTGLVILFCNSIYPVLFGTGKTLGNGRELSYSTGGGLIAMIGNCLGVFTRDMCSLIWEENVALCCAISVLLVLLWFRRKAEIRPFHWALIAIDLLSIPYFVIFSHFGYGKYLLQGLGLLDLFELVLNLGFFAIVAIQSVLLFGKTWQTGKLLTLWAAGPLTVLPLAAVVVDGSRFYLTSNVFLILFAACLLSEILKDLPRRAGQLVLALGLTAVLTLGMYYGFVYREIRICTDTRKALTAQAIARGDKQLTLPGYPYTVLDYVWVGQPREDFRYAWYKEFHGIPQDVDVEFVWE